MKSLLSLFAALLLLGTAGLGNAAEKAAGTATENNVAENPRVLMATSMGDITIELYPAKAPETVTNFLQYVDDGFYDGTIFHRVISNFMIQGGGLTPQMVKKETRAAITNEADNGLRNTVGTIAMARTGEPHSATAQFFINVRNNSSLDHREKFSSRSWGYAVFGRVVEGMEVVGAIKSVKTGRRNGRGDVPLETVMINKVSRINSTADNSGAKQ
jgi:peptidyl-prolyl cis-trans isomerase B (cyclophilin B)